MSSPAYSSGGRRSLTLFFWALVVFLYAPIVILIIFSFNDSSLVSFPWQGFTLRWYHEFLANSELLGAIRTSFEIATVSSIVTVALAIPASIALVRRRFFAKGVVSGVLFAPLVIPLVVFGIALLVLFKSVGLPLSPITVMIGHVVLAMPFAILTMVPRLERIPESLEEASRDLGGGWLRTFWSITLPLLMPAVLSAFIITFTLSFDEIVVASFVVGDQPTFPLYLYSQLRLPQRLPQVIAVAVVVMAVSLTVVMASEVARRVGDRRLERQMKLTEEVEEEVTMA
ncbi:MAG: ABC transporter permease [Actinomycetota bacterium]